MSERFPSFEGSAKAAIERAIGILGRERVHGPDQLRKAFGISLSVDAAPPMPFTTKALERANENGEILLYRPTREQCGQDLTIQRMMGLLKKEHRLFDLEDLPEDARRNKFSFFTAETPEPGWVLTRAEEIEGTRHLSYDAQRAFIANDEAALAEALQRMEEAWDDARLPRRLRPALPTVADLMRARKGLPDDVALPRAVDAVFDLLLHHSMTREHLLHDMTVATSTMLPPETDGPDERPVDISFPRDGLEVHWRRSRAYGRPEALEDTPTPGTPIGYLQHR